MIKNSDAGTADDETLERGLAVLRGATSVEVASTSDPGELNGVLHRAGSRTIVVAGGDGSMHAVVSALHRRNELSERTLALLPLGTGNDFARGNDIPLDIAGRFALNGRVRRIGKDARLRHLFGVGEVEGEPGQTTFNPLMDAVNRMNVDRFAMEFNSVASGGMAKLKDFPADKILGLGVLYPNGEHVETEEEIIQRVERAPEFVPRDRLVINPDCGFAPAADEPPSIDEAYEKLCRLTEASKRLQAKYVS